MTRCMSMDFSRHGTPHEAQAAAGDSGGAVFVKSSDGTWSLGGVMFSITRDPYQESHSSLYGNYTNAVDLSAYVDQIRNVMRTGGKAP